MYPAKKKPLCNVHSLFANDNFQNFWLYIFKKRSMKATQTCDTIVEWHSAESPSTKESCAQWWSGDHSWVHSGPLMVLHPVLVDRPSTNGCLCCPWVEVKNRFQIMIELEYYEIFDGAWKSDKIIMGKVWKPSLVLKLKRIWRSF